MNNLDAVAKWKAWVEKTESYAGDVTAADGPHVDFWFANNGKRANHHFHCFACGGDGSLIAIYSAKGGGFESGPIVHLGHEGEVVVIAEDVPRALALIAGSGSSYEEEIYLVSGGGDEDATQDDDGAALAKWLKKTFDVKPPKSVVSAVKAVDAKLGKPVRKHVQTLNGA